VGGSNAAGFVGLPQVAVAPLRQGCRVPLRRATPQNLARFLAPAGDHEEINCRWLQAPHRLSAMRSP
jgi:hypothetical protein